MPVKAFENSMMSRRHNSVVQQNRYGQGLIPTENIKFEQFLTVVQNSGVSTED